MPRDPLAEQHTLAMLDHAADRSVALLFHDSAEEQLQGIGTGFCIEIAGTFLIATAAHLFRDTHLSQIVVVGSERRTDRSPRLLDFGIRGGGDYDALDVAWIRLDPRAAQRIGKTFMSLDRLDSRPTDRDAIVYIYGFPWDRRQEREFNGRPWHLVNAIGYLTKAGVGAGARDPSPENDMFLDWPDDVNEEAPTGWLKRAPDAPGLSGGAIWSVNSKAGALWSPDAAKVVAAQHSWARNARWLRGTLIRHWLQMVAEDLPELAAHIDPILRSALASCAEG
jgi:hypothetical protein